MSTPQTARLAIEVERIIDEHVRDYVWEGDGGCYTPNETEQLLIKDAIMGLTADDDFLAAIGVAQGALQARGVSGREPVIEALLGEIVLIVHDDKLEKGDRLQRIAARVWQFQEQT